MTEKNLFIELLQVSLGCKTVLDSWLMGHGCTAVEWQHLFEEAERQAIAGILLEGVQRLKDNGAKCMEGMPQEQMLQWIGEVMQLEQQNVKTTKACQQLCEQLEKEGFKACVLKGQSNYRYYPAEMKNRRNCGDVDVWVRPKNMGCKHPVKAVIEYVQSHFDMNGLCWLHTSHMDKSGVPVEVHLRASFMSDPCKKRRFQKYFANVDACREFVELDGAKIPCMKVDEDVIYQMNHIYRHLIDEGVGLRQVVDYFWLLKAWNEQNERSREDTMKIVSHLGMKKFAGALMYVLQELLRMPSVLLLCPASVEDGKFLMNEILMSGNFGHNDPRMGAISSNGGYFRSRASQALRRFKRNMRFITSYPGEVIWEPIVRVEHFVWKKLRLWRF